MADSIGNVAVKLSANAVGFHKAVDGAGKALQSFASTAAGLGAKMAGFFAIPTSAAGFVDFIKKGEERILSQARAADQLGISMHSAAAFQFLAGDRGDEMQHALGKLEVTLGNAAAGSEEFAKKLGLVGLSAADVSHLGLDQSYKLIADRIREMKNPLDRAVAAHELFGKGGHEIIDILARGGSAFDSAAARVDKFGGSVSRMSAEAVKDATRQLADMERVMAGLGMRAAVAVAPPLSALASMGTEALENVTDPNRKWQGIYTKGFIDKAAANLVTPLPPVPMLTKEYLESLNPNAIGQPYVAPGPGRTQAQERKMQAAITETVKALEWQRDTLGMTSSELAVYELKIRGATKAELERAQALDIQRTKEANQRERDEEAHRLIDQHKPPLEAFGEGMQDIRLKLKDNLIDKNTANAAKAGLVEDLARKSHVYMGGELAQGAQYGTTAAIDAINRYQSQEVDVEQQIRDILKGAADDLRETRRLNERIAAALDNVGVAGL
jgi:hypothetical protein